MSVVKIGFPLISSSAWMGGYNYLLNLISALTEYESERVQTVLFCGKDTSDEDLRPFESIERLRIIKDDAFSNNKTQLTGIFQAMLLGKNLRASRAFSSEKLDLVFEPARFYGWRLNTPAIAWFPDFQHRHMPQLFGRMGWLKRELGFRVQIITGRTILLSSDDACKDYKEFYKIKQGRIGILKFPALIPSQLLKFDTSILKMLYNLPERFVYIPNQFWQHKNHEVVIEALGLLKARGENVTVVSTGNTYDPRNPNHFPSLQSRIKEWGIDDNFKVLGLIPREHAIGLLRICTLLINPSFFEGWNTSVEEAKALGVPMLLSKIGVHQEQAGNKATYFKPEDPEELAKLLLEQMNHNVEKLDERALLQDPKNNLSHFASEFTDIALNAL